MLLSAVNRIVETTGEVPTPHVAIDGATMERNLSSMQAMCVANGVGLRPHVKTHKSSELARRQLEIGAIGLTCATLSEAVGLGKAGVSTSIFVAAPVYVDRSKAAMLREAASLHDEMLVAVDSMAGVVALSSAEPRSNVSLMIEIDSGLGRTGVRPDEAGALAAVIAADDRLAVTGVFTHGGHGYAPGKSSAAADDEVDALAAALVSLEAAGIAIDELIVSAGSTPTVRHSSRPPVTEERPGTYVFGDHQQVVIGETALEAVAAAVVTTVIHSSPGKIVVDAGAKILTKDRQAWLDSYGSIPESPHALVTRLYDNHGVIEVAVGSEPAVGTRLVIVPNHICPVINLIDEAVLIGSDGTGRALDVDLRGHLT